MANDVADTSPRVSSLEQALATGNRALTSGDWSRARICFEAVLQECEIPEAHHGMSEALFWLNDLEGALSHRERAYLGFRRQPDLCRAAREAMILARYQFALRGSAAAFNGWMTRAERLLQEVGPCIEQGWLEIFRRAGSSDPAVAGQAAANALAIAREYGDTDLENLSLAYGGLALVAAGRLAEGMTQLDEAMAAATGQEVQHFATLGEIYCTLLMACNQAADLERAEEWCRVMEAFVASQHTSLFSANCRTHYGAVLTATGRWQAAEQVLLGVLDTFDARYHPAVRVDAVGRLAGLFIRQGRFDEASELLEGYLEYPEVALPAAALQLVRGELSLAEALLQRRLRQLSSEKSLEAVPILAMLVDVQIARAKIRDAQTTLERLTALASPSNSDGIAGVAELATARVRMAVGEDSVSHFESALNHFTRADMPFELAQARLALAHALAPHNREGAVLEARSALAAFERLGVAREADAAAQLLRQLGTPARTGPKGYGILSKREQEVLRLLGRGFSNEQIADTLYISRRTAEHHVSSILSKLGLANRAEAAAYAVRVSAKAKSVPD